MNRGKRLLQCLLMTLLLTCGLSVAHAQAPGKGKGKKAEAAQKEERGKKGDTVQKEERGKKAGKSDEAGAEVKDGDKSHPSGRAGHPGPEGKGRRCLVCVANGKEHWREPKPMVCFQDDSTNRYSKASPVE